MLRRAERSSRRLRVFRIAVIALGAMFYMTVAASADTTGQEATLVSRRTSTQRIQLNKWALVLPVNSLGQLSGEAEELRPAVIVSPWLTRQGNGGLTFWAPAGGATTPHSLHSRTELQSLTSFTVGGPGHVLMATLSVQQLPRVSGSIIIGQIHGAGTDSAAPFLFVEVKGRDLGVAVESMPKLEGSKGPAGGEVTTHYQLLGGIRLGQTFTYDIVTRRAVIVVSATKNGNGNSGHSFASVSVPVPMAWRHKSVRFSAGDYEQDDAASSKMGGGRVTFYALSMK
jgi:hypothetical protein